MKREFPEIAEGKTGFGFFCIPEGYIPSSAKIPDYGLVDEFDDEARKKFSPDIRKLKGDFAERKAYDVLQKHYKNRVVSQNGVILMQGVEIINLESPNKHREADFYVVDLNKKTIINIEVKKYLGPKKEPSNGDVSGIITHFMHSPIK